MPQNRMIKVEENKSKSVDNMIRITDDSLITIIKKYNLRPDKTSLTFYDKKRNKTMARLLKINDNLESFIDGEWLLKEAIDTKSKDLKKILQRELECFCLYKRYKKYFEEEHRKFMKNLLMWRLGKSEENQDEMDEFY